MSVIIYKIGIFWLWLGVAGLGIFPSWLVMRFITPQKLLSRYFREPHFTPTELIFFAQYPGSMIRAMIFVWACVKPHWTRKRKLDDMLEHAPAWYVMTAKIYVLLIACYAFLFFTLMFGLGIYTYLNHK